MNIHILRVLGLVLLTQGAVWAAEEKVLDLGVLRTEYDNNELAAQEKYAGKPFGFIGYVVRVAIRDEKTVTIHMRNDWKITAYKEDKIKKMKPDDCVGFIGVVFGKNDIGALKGFFTSAEDKPDAGKKMR